MSACLWCDAVFPSKAELAVHMQRKHEAKS